MKKPAWAEIEAFCRADGWTEVRSTDHVQWEKVLRNETLRTHRSFASDKTMSPGRFSSILKLQLKVTEEQFWETLRTGKPARRPSPGPLPEPVALPLWLHHALVAEVGMAEDDLQGLAVDQAQKTIDAHRSKPHP